MQGCDRRPLRIDPSQSTPSPPGLHAGFAPAANETACPNDSGRFTSMT